MTRAVKPGPREIAYSLWSSVATDWDIISIFYPMRRNGGSTMPYEEKIFDYVLHFLQEYSGGILSGSIETDCRDTAYDMLCEL